MPTFSVVIPCYNAADTLAQTLDGLMAQTDLGWEALCVDDGSSDDTAECIRRYAATDPRIRVVTHGGKGPSAARNAGVAAASGEIVAFCDADDLWVPEKLSQLRELFGNENVDAVFGRVGFWQGGPLTAQRRSTIPTAPLSIPMLLAENPVCTMSNIALRREMLERVGGFDERLAHNEDLDWLIRLVGEGAKIFGDSRLHVFYRTARAGLSADLDRMAAGRCVAVQTARRYGVVPGPAEDAIFLRHLARRALRLDNGARTAARHALAGLRRGPRAFLFPLRRGLPTAVAAILAPLLPRRLRRALFAA